MSAVDRLRRLAEQAPALGPDGEWLADALSLYLREAASGMTLDRAFGVAPARNEWPWWRREQRAREREAARQLVAVFGDVQAAHAGLRRFAVSRGRFPGPDTEHTVPKAMRAYLDATEGRVPVTAKTLRRAVDSSSMTSCPETCDPIAER